MKHQNIDGRIESGCDLVVGVFCLFKNRIQPKIGEIKKKKCHSSAEMKVNVQILSSSEKMMAGRSRQSRSRQEIRSNAHLGAASKVGAAEVPQSVLY